MANFFPLIANATANTINELPAGDFLDLSDSGISNTGNITGSNISLSGLLSAGGNITGNYFLGNGSQLTGLSAAVSVTKIVNGTSNAEINSSGGNLAVTIGGTANVMVVSAAGMNVTGAICVGKCKRSKHQCNR